MEWGVDKNMKSGDIQELEEAQHKPRLQMLFYGGVEQVDCCYDPNFLQIS